MAESINGLYKAEVIHRKSWRNRAEVELATLTWVDWYNNRRLLERLGHTPPAEAEKAYSPSAEHRDHSHDRRAEQGYGLQPPSPSVQASDAHHPG